jgi:hypothetical protein
VSASLTRQRSRVTLPFIRDKKGSECLAREIVTNLWNKSCGIIVGAKCAVLKGKKWHGKEIESSVREADVEKLDLDYNKGSRRGFPHELV